jgi:hypothetical protein
MGRLVEDPQPKFQLAFLKGWIKIIHPDARGRFVHIVTSLAIFLEKRLDHPLKKRVWAVLSIDQLPKDEQKQNRKPGKSL